MTRPTLLLSILVIGLVSACAPKPEVDLPETPRSLMLAGRFADAEKMAREEWDALSPAGNRRSTEAMDRLDLLVETLWRNAKSNSAEALEFARQAVATREEVVGGGHIDLSPGLNNLGMVLRDSGNFDEARAVFDRAREIGDRTLDADDLRTATTLHGLGGLLRKQGERVEARRLLERAVAIREAALGPDHPDLADSHHVLGLLLHSNSSEARSARWPRASLHETDMRGSRCARWRPSSDAAR